MKKPTRETASKLTDLPNIGSAMAKDLRAIGINTPRDLIGKNPFAMYETLCRTTGARHDPCVIDAFMSAVHFMETGEPLPWWSFTEERKKCSLKKGTDKHDTFKEVGGTAMMRDPEKTIGNMIDKIKVSIIGSVDEQGYPNARAMLTPRKREGIRFIYFTTNTSSMRVKQYAKNPKACVYFFDPRFFRGVMLKGTMEILQDDASKRMIWRDGDEMYYPKGVTDPDYCVLKFTAQNGRYYYKFKSEDFDVANV